MPSYKVTLLEKDYEETKHFVEMSLEKTVKLNSRIQNHRGIRNMMNKIVKQGGLSFDLAPLWTWIDDKVLLFDMITSYDMLMRPEVFDQTIKGLSKNGPMVIERIKYVKEKGDTREFYDIPHKERKYEIEKVVHDGRK